jgi:hypothetical protein
MTDITIHRPDGSTYNINIPEFHEEPYRQVSLACDDPETLINSLIIKYEGIRADLVEYDRFFPGDTNMISHSIWDTIESIDSLIHYLKMMINGTL